jgi:hypothetical protein
MLHRKFTRIVAPLFKFITKDTNFSWDDHCQDAFETLKENISKAPILRGGNGLFHFTSQQMLLIQTLEQYYDRKNQLSYAIYFISKKLTP